MELNIFSEQSNYSKDLESMGALENKNSKELSDLLVNNFGFSQKSATVAKTLSTFKKVKKTRNLTERHECFF